MPVAMNDFTRLWNDTSESILDSVRAVGESGWYILGKEVEAFEAALGSYAGRKTAVGCASGLDAIEIALRACGMPPGAQVLTTPLSAFATTLAIIRAGGVPVFVDVDERGLLNLDLAEEAMSQGQALRYLVPVHLYGHSLNLAQLAHLKSRYELTIVEDCAQAIGGTHQGVPVGSVGEAAALSFYPTKNLGALGDGGAVLTDDLALRERCRMLRDYGQRKKYEHTELGLNSRLDELHAAILCRAFLPRLTQWNARRAAIAALYTAEIDNPAIAIAASQRMEDSVWHLFPLLTAPELRTSLQDHLRQCGIQSAVHYPIIIPDQQALEGTSFRVVGELTQAREIARRELSIPIHPYLTEADTHEVVAAINSWRPQ